jgi:hypothetical protein
MANYTYELEQIDGKWTVYIGDDIELEGVTEIEAVDYLANHFAGYAMNLRMTIDI